MNEKKKNLLVKDTCLLQCVKRPVLSNGTQGFAGEFHADVPSTSAIELGYPDALLLQVGIYSAIHSLRDVPPDTPLLLGKTGSMNAAAFVRDGEGDIADS